MSILRTLYIQDTPELKIARNFLILGILINALVIPFFALPIISLILSVASFVFSTAGFYKLSKLARNHILFKYYTFCILDGVVMAIVMGMVSPNEILSSPSARFFVSILIVLICVAFYFYFFYRICFELTKITTIKFFVLAFKGMATGAVIFLIACLFFSIKEVFYLIAMFSLSVFLISGIVFVVGIFSIKKVVYYED